MLGGLAAGALILPLVPSVAHAHAFPGAGDFYGGMLHVVTSLDMLLALLALGILAGQQGRAAALAVLAALPLSALLGGVIGNVGGEVPGMQPFTVAAMVVLGGLVAAAWTLPRAVFSALAVLVGLAIGLANGADMGEGTSAWRFLPGVALSCLLVVSYALGFVRRLRAPWTHVAVRVSGSWIAAAGIMVLALG